MYKVYWTELVPAHTEEQVQVWLGMTGELLDINHVVSTVRSETFSSDELTKALAFSEQLRVDRKAGALISFVSLVSEDPNSVGQGGVSDKLPEGYDWTKQDRAGKSRRR